MPLPNTTVFGAAWSEHHQPVAQSAMVSTVDILLPTGDVPAPDPWGEPPEAEPDVLVADVPARIRPLGDDSAAAPSGQAFSTQGYLIQVPTNAAPDLMVGKGEHAHRIRITANPNDTSIEGRVLSILAYPRGSQSFAGDLICEEHTNQQQG